jgi:uncharacterized integral membrane protein
MDPVATPPSKPPAKRSRGGALTRERARLAGAGALGILLTLFAVLNLDEVEVNWLLGTWSTPLIVVVIVSALIGVALDRIVQRRSRSTAKQR